MRNAEPADRHHSEVNRSKSRESIGLFLGGRAEGKFPWRGRRAENLQVAIRMQCMVCTRYRNKQEIGDIAMARSACYLTIRYVRWQTIAKKPWIRKIYTAWLYKYFKLRIANSEWVHCIEFTLRPWYPGKSNSPTVNLIRPVDWYQTDIMLST